MLGPVSCGLLFASACSVSWSVCFLCGVFVVVAGSCWPLVVAVVFSSVALLVFALVCGVALAWLALSLLRSPPALPAPSVSPLVPLVQSVLCWSLPLGICMPVAWCVVTAWHLSSPLLKGFGPVWGSLHHVASAVPVSFLPALRYSALGDPDPPQDAARAACALLLGLCCFLLLSLLPPPAPPCLSCCCWPPPAVFPLVPVRSVKKRRAQICGQIQRFIKIPTELRRQTRTSTTHTKHKRRA